MAGNTKNLKRDANSIVAPQHFNSSIDDYEYTTGSDGALHVKLTGSNMEYYGATVADRPPANSVPVGAIFMAVNTQEIWQSNGAEWVAI